ncbi:hypothetical protein D3C84_981970 [compost metagenome]
MAISFGLALAPVRPNSVRRRSFSSSAANLLASSKKGRQGRSTRGAPLPLGRATAADSCSPAAPIQLTTASPFLAPSVTSLAMSFFRLTRRGWPVRAMLIASSRLDLPAPLKPETSSTGAETARAA